MNLIAADTMLTFIFIFIFSLFSAATFAAIFTHRALSWYEKTVGKLYWKLYSKMKKNLPESVFSGEKVWDELLKGTSESQQYSIAFWFIRLSAILIATTTGAMLIMILFS